MTTPLRRKEINNNAERNPNNTNQHRSDKTILSHDTKPTQHKILYLFLSCSEFYLPTLVGHTAALVNVPNHVISLVSDGISAGRGRKAQAVIIQKWYRLGRKTSLDVQQTCSLTYLVYMRF